MWGRSSVSSRSTRGFCSLSVSDKAITVILWTAKKWVHADIIIHNREWYKQKQYCIGANLKCDTEMSKSSLNPVVYFFFFPIVEACACTWAFCWAKRFISSSNRFLLSSSLRFSSVCCLFSASKRLWSCGRKMTSIRLINLCRKLAFFQIWWKKLIILTFTVSFSLEYWWQKLTSLTCKEHEHSLFGARFLSLWVFTYC